MKAAIVGFSGFVGSNLCESHTFSGRYNRGNIAEAFGTSPDLLVYSGVPAEMFLANKFPEKDLDIIKNAIENIRKINAERTVLISTVAVYGSPNGVNEDVPIDTSKISAYGRNRRILEMFVEERCKNALIVRLPGIFGMNLKKNFIHDLIRIVPAMLTEAKYLELSEKSDRIRKAFRVNESGFAKCVAETKEIASLRAEFSALGFTALNFTDSRGIFQYFNLKHLWSVIQTALEANIRVLNVATEPVSAAEIYASVNDGKTFVNELDKPIPYFDFRTKYAKVFGGNADYIFDKSHTLREIYDFVTRERSKNG